MSLGPVQRETLDGWIRATQDPREPELSFELEVGRYVPKAYWMRTPSGLPVHIDRTHAGHPVKLRVTWEDFETGVPTEEATEIAFVRDVSSARNRAATFARYLADNGIARDRIQCKDRS